MHVFTDIAPANAVSAQIYSVWTRDPVTHFSPTVVWYDNAWIIAGEDLTKLYGTNLLREAFTPMGSSSPYLDLNFRWTGTAHASTTEIQRRPLELWTTLPGSISGSATVSPDGVVAFTAISEPGTGGLFSGMSGENITPGVTYYPGIAVRPADTGSVPAFLKVRWFDSGGILISEETASGNHPLTYGEWSTISGSPVVAPVGAVKAAVGVVLSTPIGYLRRVPIYITNVRLNPYQASGFFDGMTPDTPTRAYTWEGDPMGSISRSTPQVATVITDQLRDPDCDPLPVPPAPPTITDPCSSEVVGWDRWLFTVSEANIAASLKQIPELRISASESLGAMRVWVYANPSGHPPSSVSGEPEAYWEVTYLPEGAELILDSLYGEARAAVDGEEIPADRLVIGESGRPLTWPVLSCGQGYVIFIDTPKQLVGEIRPTLTVLTRRAYA